MAKIYFDLNQIDPLIFEAIASAKAKGEKSISLFEVFRQGPLSNRDEILIFSSNWNTYSGVIGNDDKGNWYLE